MKMGIILCKSIANEWENIWVNSKFFIEWKRCGWCDAISTLVLGMDK
jgi:hypothetical protein